MNTTVSELRDQWVNPGDIMTILLLIGGDIIQKAIAQLIGHKIHFPWDRTRGLSIAPVAFSFGWVAYAFSNLLLAVGNMRLMPTSDCPSILVNCSNGFVREVRSFVLGRLLRDHEIRFEVDPRSEEDGGRAESLRIDIFNLEPVSRPAYDFAWWVGWVVLLMQVGIAILPWVLYGDWGILLITLCGNLLVVVTCAIPQWEKEKWAGTTLRSDKVTCLTRGNGHLHVLVLIGGPGAWDLENLATGAFTPRSGTRWVCLVLAMLWICLLIGMSGLKEHTWFLLAIGGIGMLQNIFAAGVPRKPSASTFHMTKFSRAPTIIGKRQGYRDDASSSVDLKEDIKKVNELESWASQPPITKRTRTAHKEIVSMPRWLASMSKDDGTPGWLEPLKPECRPAAHTLATGGNRRPSLWGSPAVGGNNRDGIIYAVGVHGALMELEKWVPTAGLAMVQILFPGGLKYKDESIRDNVHKKFWQKAYHTKSVRKMAEEKRRSEERIISALNL